MDQIKIGKFIAESRKKNNLTQMQLAEKLNITDRAISKWENGKAMPDSSIMLDLCNELKISVNELLSGEMIDMNNYNEIAEKNLLEIAKKEEMQNKKLMMYENVIGFGSTISFLTLIVIFLDKINSAIILLNANKNTIESTVNVKFFNQNAVINVEIKLQHITNKFTRKIVFSIRKAFR